MNDWNQLQWKTVDHFKKKLFLNLCEGWNLAKMMKKVLNVSSLKSQQLMIGVRSLSICTLFLDTHSSKILNLKKEIEKKDSVFVKIDVVWQ